MRPLRTNRDKCFSVHRGIELPIEIFKQWSDMNRMSFSSMYSNLETNSGKDPDAGKDRRAVYITQNMGLDEAQAGIKISGRNINNLRYADDTIPYGRKRKRTKEPVDESERGE